MDKTSNFSTRLATNLFILCLLALIVYVGQGILIPIGFAVMLAMLLLPMVKWLVRKGIPDIVASILAILVAIIFVSGIVYFLSAQIANFMEDLPAIKEKLQHHWISLQSWIDSTFNISKQQQNQVVENAKENVQSSGPGSMGTAMVGLAGSLMTMILLPIYTFLILFYRRLIHKFLIMVFPAVERNKVEEILEESHSIVRAYLTGLLIEMLLVTVLNAVGFLIVGIQYAIFLAVLAAVLNIIPYIGMLIATVVCLAITLTTTDNLSAVLWTAAVLTIVQFIDNNFITPYIVAPKVQINALASIVGVFVGGALAGISGMFLSIPVMAILKAIFDRVENLKPWGILLGDERKKKKR
ncbi:AI-2E family transporter [Niastella sp. OAS944]|uniref:AI-2E family transporter n=1 Tax=Niastella sp. OAS944 TaxID=2664089 RepID=UPI00346CEDF6|nr:putative PurR-regulated permease PerM [Chitinophagaceae bacterium OAS944]